MAKKRSLPPTPRVADGLAPKLQGRTFVLTGRLVAGDHKEVAGQIEAEGGRVVAEVAPGVDYLVIGRPPRDIPGEAREEGRQPPRGARRLPADHRRDGVPRPVRAHKGRGGRPAHRRPVGRASSGAPVRPLAPRLRRGAAAPPTSAAPLPGRRPPRRGFLQRDPRRQRLLGRRLDRGVLRRGRGLHLRRHHPARGDRRLLHGLLLPRRRPDRGLRL